jgi:hypothetical protein
MIIILDTQVLVSDFAMQGADFKTLLSGLERVGMELYMPRVVFDETVNKYEEKFEKLLDRAHRLGVNSLESISGNMLVSSEEARNDYQAYLSARMRDVNTQYIDYPNVEHSVLMERALARKKPFRNSDTGGYRDTLIWMSIMELASDNKTVAFISGNIGDFADTNKKYLHPDLLEDIRQQGDDFGDITFFPNLNDFIEQHIKPTLEYLDEITQKIENDTYEEFRLSDLLFHQLYDDIKSEELDPVEIGFPPGFESITLDAIEELFDIREVDVRKLSDNEIIVSFSAEIEASFSFFIYKSDYYGHPRKLELFDDDWNKWYMLVGTITRVILSQKFIYNQDLNEITSSKIIKLEEIAG